MPGLLPLTKVLNRSANYAIAIGSLASTNGHRMLCVNVQTDASIVPRVHIIASVGPITVGNREQLSHASIDLPAIRQNVAITRMQADPVDPSRATFHVMVDGVWTRYDVVLHDDDTLRIEAQPEPAAQPR